MWRGIEPVVGPSTRPTQHRSPHNGVRVCEGRRFRDRRLIISATGGLFDLRTRLWFVLTRRDWDGRRAIIAQPGAESTGNRYSVSLVAAAALVGSLWVASTIRSFLFLPPRIH
jgi:hypothetical protein